MHRNRPRAGIFPDTFHHQGSLISATHLKTPLARTRIVGGTHNPVAAKSRHQCVYIRVSIWFKSVAFQLYPDGPQSPYFGSHCREGSKHECWILDKTKWDVLQGCTQWTL